MSRLLRHDVRGQSEGVALVTLLVSVHVALIPLSWVYLLGLRKLVQQNIVNQKAVVLNIAFFLVNDGDKCAALVFILDCRELQLNLSE